MITPWSKSFLDAYDMAPLEIRKKARILRLVNTVMFAAFMIAGIGINVVVRLTPRTALLEIATGLCLFMALYILRAGHYVRASNVTIAATSIGLTVAGFCGYSGEPMLDFALLGFNVLPVIFYSCLIGCRKYQPLAAMAICLAANSVYFGVTFPHGPAGPAAAAHYAMLINSTLLIAVSGVVGYHILSINREVIAIAEDEARSSREKTDQIAKAEERFRTIFNAVNDAIFIHDIDSGAIIDVNQRMTDMYGYLPTEACRLNVEALSSGKPPYSQAESLARMRRAREEGPQVFEWQARAKNGRIFWVEVNMRSARISGEERLLVTVRDIAERKTAEERIAAEKERLLVTLRSIGDGVIATDTLGKVVLMNPIAEQLTGWEQHDAMGKQLTDVFRIVNEQSRCPVQNPVELVLAKGAVVGLANHTVLIARDGSERQIADSGAPIRDSAGIIIGVVLVFRDVTRNVRMEQSVLKLEADLRQSQKLEAVGRLAGGVAHDFNNLLTSIMGFGGLILDSLQDSSSRRDMQEILKSARRAASLTGQLLTVARKKIVDVQPVNLSSLLQGMEKLLSRTLGEDVTLTTELDKDAGYVLADVGCLEQVLLNLAINARQAMPNGGRLSIRVDSVEFKPDQHHILSETTPVRYVRLQVQDTGCGMSAEVRRHLFEPFFTTKEVGQGTGLGLSIVYGIVKQFAGHIDVDSQPGAGATFNIYFRQLTAVEHVATQSQPPLKTLPTGSETILLAEDDDAVQRFNAHALRLLGYNVITANNGTEALTVCERHSAPIHLLLTDVVMPQMNGPQLAQRLLSLRPDIKILYVSGFTNDVLEKHGIDADSDTILQKPYTQQILAEKVRHALDNRGAATVG